MKKLFRILTCTCDGSQVFPPRPASRILVTSLNQVSQSAANCSANRSHLAEHLCPNFLKPPMGSSSDLIRCPFPIPHLRLLAEETFEDNHSIRNWEFWFFSYDSKGVGDQPAVVGIFRGRYFPGIKRLAPFWRGYWIKRQSVHLECHLAYLQYLKNG